MANASTPSRPSWTLHAWPPVLWQLGTRPFFQLHHRGTQITQPGDQVNRLAGQTIWAGSDDDGGEAGMAWDWVQLSHGIVAMADPLSVITNLRLVGPEGELLPTVEAARHLNQIVHALPWQSEVERALVSAPN